MGHLYLQADGGGVLEGLVDLWVHCNHVVSRQCHLLVPFFDLPLYPLNEAFTNDSCHNINKELSWQPGNFIFIRETSHHFRDHLGVLHNFKGF